jgi:hypothetical protein
MTKKLVNLAIIKVKSYKRIIIRRIKNSNHSKKHYTEQKLNFILNSCRYQKCL